MVNMFDYDDTVMPFSSRLEIVPSDKAADGSFTRNLAEPSNVPKELAIGGTWTGSLDYWDSWVSDRVSKT